MRVSTSVCVEEASSVEGCLLCLRAGVSEERWVKERELTGSNAGPIDVAAAEPFVSGISRFLDAQNGSVAAASSTRTHRPARPSERRLVVHRRVRLARDERPRAIYVGASSTPGCAVEQAEEDGGE